MVSIYKYENLKKSMQLGLVNKDRILSYAAHTRAHAISVHATQSSRGPRAANWAHRCIHSASRLLILLSCSSNPALNRLAFTGSLTSTGSTSGSATRFGAMRIKPYPDPPAVFIQIKLYLATQLIRIHTYVYIHTHL